MMAIRDIDRYRLQRAKSSFLKEKEEIIPFEPISKIAMILTFISGSLVRAQLGSPFFLTGHSADASDRPATSRLFGATLCPDCNSSPLLRHNRQIKRTALF